VTPWSRYYYSFGRDIDITAYRRQLASGQGSWSSFFARLKIQPDESKEVGLDSPDKAADLARASNMPGQSNLLSKG
jgi:hypothetical protein